MNITKRLFSYPILADDKNDYNTSIFDVRLEQRMNNVNSIYLQFDITMDNQDIEKLIKEGKAEYVIHMECSATSYRTTLHSSIKCIDYELSVNKVSGRLDIVALVVLKQDVYGFLSYDWNEDYDGVEFDLKKANIIAYKNIQEIDVIKNYEELSNINSIFTIHKKYTEEAKPIEVELNADKIRIGLGVTEYDNYVRLSGIANIKVILNTMIILPVLIYVFEELKQADGIEEYSARPWFVSLSKSYEKRGIELKDELINGDKTSLILAQEAMEQPISISLCKILELYDNEEEEI